MKSKKTTKKRGANKTKPTAKPATTAAPNGMHAITPHLVCAGAADAIEFYKKAFGAAECMRLPGPQGKLMHASVRIGDSIVMLVDEFPEYGSLGPKSLKGSPVTIHLNVPDVDATVAHAVKAGAKITMPVEDMFWGARYGRLEDPFGHQWSVATYIREVGPEELQKAAAQMQAGGGR
jgi:PhnB protein